MSDSNLKLIFDGLRPGSAMIEGSLGGIILGRHAQRIVACVNACQGIPTAALETAGEQPVLEGGPVKTERGFILHSDDVHFDASLSLGNGLMLSTARQTLEAIGGGNGPKRYLVALGYAGWGGGQLENEMLENIWLSCPADADILFDVPFDQRVNRAAASLGIDFRLIANQAGHA